MSEASASRSQRLDKWLWFTRIAKTRTLAARLITSGKARINRVRASRPSQAVRPGDVVTLMIHRRVRVLRVLEGGRRRGPATEAATLYEDLSPPREANRTETARVGPTAVREPGSGRPTKRDRRRMDAWISEHSGSAGETDAP